MLGRACVAPSTGGAARSGIDVPPPPTSSSSGALHAAEEHARNRCRQYCCCDRQHLSQCGKKVPLMLAVGFLVVLVVLASVLVPVVGFMFLITLGHRLFHRIRAPAHNR
eukprot:COSAG01_NODE_40801_length_459_cov_1.630556_1_plen_108_part_01